MRLWRVACFKMGFGPATPLGGHGRLQQLLAHHCDDNFSTMGSSPMFKQRLATMVEVFHRLHGLDAAGNPETESENARSGERSH